MTPRCSSCARSAASTRPPRPTRPRSVAPSATWRARAGCCSARCTCAVRPRRLSEVRRGLLAISLLVVAIPACTQQPGMLARAKALELGTPYVPPPGDPLEHHAAGFAKIICSAVYVTGLAPEFAAENLGFFTAPYEERAKLGKPVVDRARKAVHVTLPNGITRTAVFLGDQGCVTLPEGRDSVSFRPVRVASRLRSEEHTSELQSPCNLVCRLLLEK